jgi:hypothetical protein
MNNETVKITIDTLEEADAQVDALVTPGLRLVDKKIICDGKSKTVSATAPSEEAAFSTAKKKIPENASIDEEKVVVPSVHEVMVVEAFDEETATAEVKTATTNKQLHNVGIKLIEMEAGSKGFLGIGKKPNQYKFDINRQARVEVTYTPKVVVQAVIGKELTPEEQQQQARKALAQALKGQDKAAAFAELRQMDRAEIENAADIFVPALAFSAWGSRKPGQLDKDYSAEVQEFLSELGETAMKQLLAMFNDQNVPGNVQVACVALTKLGEDTLAAEARTKLGAYVEGHNQYYSFDAITAMIAIGDEYVVNFLRLVALKSHPDEQVRMRAAQALGLIGDKRAIPDLKEAALKDRSWQNVQPVAKWALEKLSQSIGEAVESDG